MPDFTLNGVSIIAPRRYAVSIYDDSNRHLMKRHYRQYVWRFIRTHVLILTSAFGTHWSSHALFNVCALIHLADITI